MNDLEYYLVCGAEEAGEVAQCFTKILRFGPDSVNPLLEQPSPTNTEDLVLEVNDILAILELLQENGLVLNGLGNREAIEKKKAKVKRLMSYDIDRGILDQPKQGT